MPRMDGTGPRGMGIGCGMGRRQGQVRMNRCGNGFGFGRRSGFCRFARNADNRDALVVEKEALQARLAEVDQLLEKC